MIALPGLAQLLPVGQLGDDARALGADRVGRVAQVRAQLRVRELARARPPGSVVTSVDARISARCSGADGERRAREAAADLQQARAVDRGADLAPVASIASHLSASIALDVSAFLIANVPPKPQHSSARGSSTSSSPRTLPQQAQRRVADARHAQRVAGRVVGDAAAGTTRRRPRRRAGARAAPRARRHVLRCHSPSGRVQLATVPTHDDDGETTASYSPKTRHEPLRRARAPRRGSRCSRASARSTSAPPGTRPRGRAARAPATVARPPRGRACRRCR